MLKKFLFLTKGCFAGATELFEFIKQIEGDFFMKSTKAF